MLSHSWSKPVHKASLWEVGRNPGAGSIYHENRQKAAEHILAMHWHMSVHVSILPSLIHSEVHGFKSDYVNLSKMLM